MILDYSRIKEYFDQFKNLRVLVVGDVMLDSYVQGNITRISPEAPVPVVKVENKEYRLGGASNVAKNIEALEAKAIICSVIGNDAMGEKFRELMSENGLSEEGLVFSETRMTTVKTRVLSGTQQMVRLDEESDHILDNTEQTGLLNAVDQVIQNCDLVIFQDYDKGCLSSEVISAIMQKANVKGIPTMVDPKRKNFFDYAGCTLFKPNLRELRDALSDEVAVDVSSINSAMERVRSRMKFRNSIVTLSEYGAFFMGEDSGEILPTQKRSIADVSGAGDTVISIASLCLTVGISLADTTLIANCAGGQVCESPGVVSVDKEKLLEELAGLE